MKPTDINFENVFTPYKARKLTEADIPDILNLYSGNTEYFKHCHPSPTRETVKEDLVALPPEKEAADKYFIGIFDDNFLVWHTLRQICPRRAFGSNRVFSQPGQNLRENIIQLSKQKKL